MLRYSLSLLRTNGTKGIRRVHQYITYLEEEEGVIQFPFGAQNNQLLSAKESVIQNGEGTMTIFRIKI